MKGNADQELGQKVKAHLIKLGIETPIKERSTPMMPAEVRKNAIKTGMHGILELLGLDLTDDSIEKTPGRVAKMFVDEIFYGLDYANFPKIGQFSNKMKYEEMVCVKNILVRSVCEHHLVPFIGQCTIAYLPKDFIIGLSKFNRVVDFFSRRPQVQERLTEQVHAALSFILETDDVAVVIDSAHYCVKLRGVEDPSSATVTSKITGKFRSEPALRHEFISLSSQHTRR